MRRYLLPLVLFLAFVLRVFWLDKYPSGFTPDEASFGYDAYSLLKTGKDQWGHTLPLVLESFGDFKAPLYSYLSIPFVALFGLSRPVIRLPNALLGTAAVYVTYLLVRKARKLSELEIGDWKLEILSATLLAISPWHVMMSRGAFEANLTTFFLPLGILLFLESLKNPKYLLWSSLVFGLNLFSYHSAKLVTPLILVFLALLFQKNLAKFKKSYLYKASFFFLIFFGLTLYSFTQGAGRRISDIGVFSGALEAQAKERLTAIHNGVNPFFARMLHNKYQVVVSRFWNNYKQYFSYKFLFADGPGEGTYGMIPGRGVLYLFELFTLLSFIFAFLVNRKSKVFQLLVFWLLIAPTPAALTMGVGYAANRATILLPAVQIASAYGLFWLLILMTKTFSKKVAKIFELSLIFLLLVSFLSFTKDYYLLSPKKISQPMLYANLEVSYWLAANAKDKVVVSTSLSEPHIYIAFANKWYPVDYQKQAQDWQKYKDEGLSFLDQLEKYQLGNYIFKKINKNLVSEEGSSLFVGKPEEFAANTLPLKVFKYPNGSEAIYVVGSQNENFAQNRPN